MDVCPGHILESTKGIEIKLGTYIDVNKRKCRRQEPTEPFIDNRHLGSIPHFQRFPCYF